MNFEGVGASPCYVSQDGTIKIEKDSEVRLKITGTRVDANEIVSML